MAGIVGGLPLFAVLYWLAVEQGSWLRVLVVHVLVIVIAFVLWLRFRAGFVEVTSESITKQALARHTVLPVSRVASTIIAHTYGGPHSENVPQLICLDSTGDRVFRMRGTYWSLDDMRTVAAAIGAPITVTAEATTAKEFYATYPGVAYWYEGRAWVRAVGIIIAFGIAFVTMSWLMSAIGVPSVLSMPF